MAAEVEAIAVELHGLRDPAHDSVGLEHRAANPLPREHVGSGEAAGPAPRTAIPADGSRFSPEPAASAGFYFPARARLSLCSCRTPGRTRRRLRSRRRGGDRAVAEPPKQEMVVARRDDDAPVAADLARTLFHRRPRVVVDRLMHLVEEENVRANLIRDGETEAGPHPLRVTGHGMVEFLPERRLLLDLADARCAPAPREAGEDSEQHAVLSPPVSVGIRPASTESRAATRPRASIRPHPQAERRRSRARGCSCPRRCCRSAPPDPLARADREVDAVNAPEVRASPPERASAGVTTRCWRSKKKWTPRPSATTAALTRPPSRTASPRERTTATRRRRTRPPTRAGSRIAMPARDDPRGTPTGTPRTGR